jgi:DNA-3-methyladenine glycosylase
MRKLPRDFYTRDVLRVARELPGKVFVKKRVDTILAGKIVEVEAYSGAADEAAHSFGGVTARNQVMFREGGILYVYFTYGMHYCCNVVTGREGEGNAVLLRAMEPLEGIETMMRNRFGESKKDFRNLTNGPAKICRAFGIDSKDNGVDLLGDDIYILDGETVSEDSIHVSRRIGIKKSTDLPWRFYIKENPFASKK